MKPRNNALSRLRSGPLHVPVRNAWTNWKTRADEQQPSEDQHGRESRRYGERNAADAEHGERNSQNQKPAPGFADLFDSVGSPDRK